MPLPNNVEAHVFEDMVVKCLLARKGDVKRASDLLKQYIVRHVTESATDICSLFFLPDKI